MRDAVSRLLHKVRALGSPGEPPMSATPAASTVDSTPPAPAIPEPDAPTGVAVLESYVADPPSPQLAVDVFKGDWSSKLPEHLGVTAGEAQLFDDGRITWLLEQCGELTGRTVLELGPLEGGHSYQLARAGARVTAVEGNTRAYLKCLIVKELLGMDNCTFLLGDFVKYLEVNADADFHMALASGVLYHSTDPLHLLELLARTSDRIALWTHYYDPDVVAAKPSVARLFSSETVTVQHRGTELLLHRRDYLEALQWTGFCGGPESYAFWLERDGLLTVLAQLGFSDVRIGSDEPDHVNGPCILLYAQR